MSESLLLKQVADDLVFLKHKVITIEDEIKEISTDLHIVRPSYIKKLDKIKKGKFHKYTSFEQLQKELTE